MKANAFEFELISRTPLLMHADDIEKNDEVREWIADPANKKRSVAGDDRTPPWTWMSYTYESEGKIVIPSDNIMVALRHAGASIPAGKGKGSKTLKSMSQSGILIEEPFLDLLVEGKLISTASFPRLREATFTEQKKAVAKLGFDLLVKRAKPPGQNSKHVRVRPLFTSWRLKGSFLVTDPDILTLDVMQTMFALAGRYAGLGDWRPSAPRAPGRFGQFEAIVKELRKTG